MSFNNCKNHYHSNNSCFSPAPIYDKCAGLLNSISSLFNLYNNVRPSHAMFYYTSASATDANLAVAANGTIPFASFPANTNTSDITLAANQITFGTAGVYEVIYTILVSNIDTLATGATADTMTFEDLIVPQLITGTPPTTTTTNLIQGSQYSFFQIVRTSSDLTGSVSDAYTVCNEVTIAFHVSVAANQKLQLVAPEPLTLCNGYDAGTSAAAYPSTSVTIKRLGPVVA